MEPEGSLPRSQESTTGPYPELQFTNQQNERTNKQTTNFMEQSPSWEANTHWAVQEIPRLVWNPKVHYRVHKNLPLVPVLNPMDPVHKFSPCFPKIESNIILESKLRSLEWSLPFRFSNQISLK